MDTEEFIEEVANRLTAYIASADDVKRVNPNTSPAGLRLNLTSVSPSKGSGLDTVLDDLDSYIANSVNTHRSEFMNPLWGGLSLPALAGDIVSTTNNAMYTFELSPMGTLIERALIDRMNEIVGFPDGFGTFTTGGSNGNMLGMLCAREQHAPASSKTGIDGRKMAIFVSAESTTPVLMGAKRGWRGSPKRHQGAL